MPKRKTMTVAITSTQRKFRDYLTLDQNLGKNFKMVNKDNTFTSAKYSQSILCQNKPKLLPNSHSGVYQLDSSCIGRYIGDSKKKALTSCIEHQQDSIKDNWESSGATKHTKECHGQFSWIYPRKIVIMPNMYKKGV